MQASQATALLPDEEADPLPLPTVIANNLETVDDVVFDDDLTHTQKNQLKSGFLTCSSIMTTDPDSFTGDLVQQTRLGRLFLGNSIHYPLLPKRFSRSQVKSILQMGVIEPSSSPYCASVVLSKKKDLH